MRTCAYRVAECASAPRAHLRRPLEGPKELKRAVRMLVDVAKGMLALAAAGVGRWGATTTKKQSHAAGKVTVEKTIFS